jgi:transcription-repair coupling factor (superfamily II helicase)
VKRGQTSGSALAGLIEQESTLELSGVTNSSAKSWLMAQAVPQLAHHWALLWLVRNVKEGEELFHQLSFWAAALEQPLRVTDLLPSNLTALNDLLTGQRGITILSLPVIHEAFPSPALFQRSILKVSTGQEIDLTTVIEHLVTVGYESDQQASAPGSFAKHGGVLEVFSSQWAEPHRIEFNGRRIESIQAIDVRSKRSRPQISSLTILPHALKNTAMGASVFDFLPPDRTCIVSSDPESFQELDHEWPKLSQKIRRYRSLTFHTFGTRRSIAFDFQAPKLYHRHLDQFTDDVRKLQREEYDVTLITEHGSEVKKLFKSEGLPLPSILKPTPGHRIYGWTTQNQQKAVFTDGDIFGERTSAESKSSNQQVNASVFIAELRPGDYVVHLDHGIGHFTGMTTNKIDGITKEYFVVEYAEGDKLFVPVEAAEKISKYFGLAQPKLHRLSGSNWYQVTHKIREEATKIAQELLRLYAERDTSAASAMPEQPEERALADSFPYELTPDQERVIMEVSADMAKNRPMDRLVCGDVGFGKTEVAIRAAVRAVLHGKQVAVLSPTTILTQQHYDTFRERLKGFNISVEILSRFRSDKEQDAVIQKLVTRDVDIIIGTHRLLSPDIHFRDLGLIIIDEEQRFGVRHKEQLKKLRTQAHILTLSATPIPRTLNFALSGLRDISVIETPPEGRLPIDTIIKPYDDEIVIQAIRSELERNGQAYYLYNNVETIDLAAQRLSKLVPEARIGIAHGQMAEEELARAMSDFDNLKTNILVCSTIIESGLDLPNVNTLIVDNSPKFGLAQLYQLRGRVGRSKRQAYAYFLYHASKLSEAARKRLQALLEAKELGSGFQIALRDLEIRGTGNLLGREQHGKVAAIGLALYTRLLAQAIDELKSGKIPKPLRDVQIDLPIEIGIPKILVPSEPKRLKIYQQLAGLTTEKDLANFIGREFRGVDLPPPLASLFEVLKIKILSQRTDLTHLTASKSSVDGTLRERILLKFASKVSPEAMTALRGISEEWSFMGDQAKIEKAALGPDWLKTLESIIRKLQLPE